MSVLLFRRPVRPPHPTVARPPKIAPRFLALECRFCGSTLGRATVGSGQVELKCRQRECRRMNTYHLTDPSAFRYSSPDARPLRA